MPRSPGYAWRSHRRELFRSMVEVAGVEPAFPELSEKASTRLVDFLMSFPVREPTR